MPVLSRSLVAGRNDASRSPHERRLARTFRGCTPTLVRAEAPERAPPSPCTGPRPVSRPSPTGPTLRANPYPEVTDLACRLPLPTLFYRLEAVHLGDRMRIWVRAGTKVCIPPPGFSSPRPERRGRRKNRGALRGQDPLSDRPGSQGPRPLNQKRQLFPALRSGFSRIRCSPCGVVTRDATTPRVRVPE